MNEAASVQEMAAPPTGRAVRWTSVVSTLLFASLLVIVAAGAIILHERSGEWWAPVLAPVGALSVLLLGAMIRQPDMPLTTAVSALLELPGRHPRVAAITAIAALAAAIGSFVIARAEIVKPDGTYWVQIYRDENVAGQRVKGLEVVMERQAGPKAMPEVLSETTDESGSVYFPVWVNQTISLRLVRNAGSETYFINPADSVTAEMLGKPQLINLSSIPEPSWKDQSQGGGSPSLLAQEDGIVGILRTDPYYFRWTDGFPQQPPIGPAELEAAVAPFGLPPAETVVRREAYTVGFSPYLRLARWAAYRVLPGGSVRRDRDNFSPDPAIPTGVQASNDDYARNPFDRGHLVRRSDVGTTTELANSVNFLSAVAPQTDILNRRAWLAIEEFASTLGKAPGHQVYVIRGPMFLSSGQGVDMQVRVIGPGRLPVPSHYFQVVLDVTPQGRQLHCFVAPNEFVLNDLPQAKQDIADHYRARLSVIEDGTGLRLLPRLDRTTAAGC